VGEGADLSPVPRPGVARGLLLIAQELHEIESALIECGGELPAPLEERLSEVSIAREQKVDSYAAIIRRAESLGAEYKEHAETILDIAQGAKKLIARLKNNIKAAMLTLGVDTLKGDQVQFRMSHISPKVDLFNEDELPSFFMRKVTKLEPDLELIKEHLEAGKQVPGARLRENYAIRVSAAKKGTK
jgi:hypothetical protein